MPKSSFGKALRYALAQWPEIGVHLSSPEAGRRRAVLAQRSGAYLLFHSPRT